MNLRTLRYLKFAVLGIAYHPRRAARRRTGKGTARNRQYRAWIRTMLCCACGSGHEVEAAHTGLDGGTGLKASDYSCVPLCQGCHTFNPRAYHRIGRDAFERLWNLDFKEVVSRLNAAYAAKVGKL